MYDLIFIAILCLVPLNFIIIDRFYVVCSLFLLSAILTLLCGFRAIGVDQDSYNYFFMFNMFNNYFDSLSVGVEPGFSVLTTLLKKVGLDSMNYLFLVFALLSVPIKIRFIYKYSKYPILSILIFYSFMYFKQDFTAVRAAVAIGLFLWAIDDLFERNKYKYFIKIALACFFHISSIAYIPIYFLNTTTINKRMYFWWLWLSAIISNIGLFTVISRLPIISMIGKVEKYSQKVSSGAVEQFNPHGVLFMFNLFLATMIVIFSERIIIKDNRSVLFIKLTVIGNCINFIFGALSATLSGRLSDLFLIMTIISYTYFIYFIRPRVAGIIISVMVAIVLFWFNIYYVNIVNDYFSWLL